MAPQILRTVAEVKTWAEALRKRGPPARAGAHHGLPARGPPVAHARGAQPGGRGGHLHLRQPHAVRPPGGSGPLPAGLRGRSRQVRQRGRGRRLRARGRGHVPARLPDVRRGDGGQQGAVRRSPSRALPRRGHHRHPAAVPVPARGGALRREGLPAAPGDQGAQPGSAPGRGDRRHAHGARGGRAGDELSQCLPLPGRAAARARHLPGACRGTGLVPLGCPGGGVAR